MGIEDGARLRFGFSGKFWEWRARLVLCGPFVGGGYVYIDPTPSKKVSASNIDVVPRNMGAIAAGMGAAGRAWGMSAWAGGVRRHDQAGARAGANTDKGNGLQTGGLQPPQFVVGSYSQVGLTLGNIGLQIGGAAFLSDMRLTCN